MNVFFKHSNNNANFFSCDVIVVCFDFPYRNLNYTLKRLKHIICGTRLVTGRSQSIKCFTHLQTLPCSDFLISEEEKLVKVVHKTRKDQIKWKRGVGKGFKVKNFPMNMTEKFELLSILWLFHSKFYCLTKFKLGCKAKVFNCSFVNLFR